jgi:hypothetical protein
VLTTLGQFTILGVLCAQKVPSQTIFFMTALPPTTAEIPNIRGLLGPSKAFTFKAGEKVLQLELPRLASGASAKLKLESELGIDAALLNLVSESTLVSNGAKVWDLPSTEFVVNVISREAAIVANVLARKAGSADIPILPAGVDGEALGNVEALESKVLGEVTAEELALIQQGKPEGVSDLSAVLTYLQVGRNIELAKGNFA